ncbi:hypothetical protein INR49_009503 [Caranx melampygus]|nr:hypothetical protein INR49_009503 [Caranx melampygus]
MADSGRARPAARHRGESDGESALCEEEDAAVSRAPPKYQSSAPGHCFRKVTLTKPTFCHSCSDFIWGLIGFLCEGAGGSLLWSSHSEERFCGVCRKQTEGNAALRCEVCELHVHADCAAFSCADCRNCHLDGTLQQETFTHHWREGNLSSAAKCEVCRRSCGSSDIMTGVRCEWCGITIPQTT